MSVVASPSRPYPSPRNGRNPVVRRRAVPAGPLLTITVDLSAGAGPITPYLSRLLDLLGELAGAGQEAVRVSGLDLLAVTSLRGGAETVRAEVEPDPATLAVEPADAVLPPSTGPAAPPPRPPVPPVEHSGTEVRILAGTRMVRHGERLLPLTRLEFDLLLFLAEHPRQVFTRRQLLSNVWGYEHAVARTVDVHVRRLRAKAGPDLSLITTVYGVGYRLADEAWIIIDRSR